MVGAIMELTASEMVIVDEGSWLLIMMVDEVATSITEELGCGVSVGEAETKTNEVEDTMKREEEGDAGMQEPVTLIVGPRPSKFVSTLMDPVVETSTSL